MKTHNQFASFLFIDLRFCYRLIESFIDGCRSDRRLRPDLNHSDIVSKLWTNTAEIPRNGLDDDANGVVDDVTDLMFLALPA